MRVEADQPRARGIADEQRQRRRLGRLADEAVTQRRVNGPARAREVEARLARVVRDVGRAKELA